MVQSIIQLLSNIENGRGNTPRNTFPDATDNKSQNTQNK